jgi:hypothetical protein
MSRPSAVQAIGAGFLATFVMTLLASLAPLAGMPAMDFAAMLGQFLTGQPAPLMSAPWWLGMAVHFVDGAIVFALVYAMLVYPLLPGAPWLRGATWGVVLWFLSQVLVMPAMGLGLFWAGSPSPAASVIGSLIAHLVYGAVLGGVAGAGVAHAEESVAGRRAA